MTWIVVLIAIITGGAVAAGGGGGGGGGGGSSSSGSSSGGGSGGSSGIDASWIVTSTEADKYRTSEYNANWGLEAIHAAEAYASLEKNDKTVVSGSTVAGKDVKIGIVDSGALTTHVEVASNYVATGSYDFVSSTSSVSDGNGHGTHVASIAAGVKDSSGVQGVAFGADILAERVLNSLGTGSSFNVANGITQAVDYDAKVINLSLGGDYSSFIDNAILGSDASSAKSNDVLTVAATGNYGDTTPIYPAELAKDGGGYVIAVGSVGTGSAISSFSNRCGDAKDFCMVAPGENIYAAMPIGSTTDLDPDYGCDSSGYCALYGTSMATPFVSGSAAVLRAAWPHLTAPQVTQILLRSATDLGASGTDTTYGHGMLNLYAAVQAQGSNTLGYGASVDSGGYDVRSSSIISDSIFGDAFTANVASGVENAVFFDDFGRDYKAFLPERISSKSSQSLTYLESIAFSNIANKTIPLNFNNNQIKVNFSSYKNGNQNFYGLKHLVIDNSKDPQNQLTQGFAFTNNSFKTKIGFAFNIDEVANLESEKFGNFGFVSFNNFAANPYQSFFSGTNSTLQNSKKFNQFFAKHDVIKNKLALKFSWQNSFNNGAVLGNSSKQNQSFDFGFSLTPKKGNDLILSFGNLTEFNNNMLNSQSLGAFSTNGNVKTSYVKISANQNLYKDLSLITGIAEGTTTIQGNSQGIFRNFSDVRSRTSSVALVYDNFFKGRIGLSYSEPMRVYKGSAQINIPVARDINGNVTRYESTISLVPNGKQQNLELFYSRDLSDYSNIKFNLITQKQPGNIANAKTNNLLWINYGLRF